jgi:hypothetical protein
MRPSDNRRLVTSAVLLAAVIGLAGCGGGGGEGTALPSAGVPERSVEVTAEPTRTRTRTAEPTTTPAEAETTTPAEAETTTPAAAETTTTRPPPAVAAPPGPTQTARTTTPAKTTTPASTTKPATTPAASAAAVAAAESESVGPYGWLLVIGLLTMLGVGCALVYRSQQKSAWDDEARAVKAETRTITATRVPPVLTTTTVAQRGLAWPPVRAGLTDLVRRCDSLAASALGEPRRLWAGQLGALLRDLIAAVDAENEALAGGRDWRVLRPGVNQAERALNAALTNQLPEPPPAGEPGPPAYQI